MNKDIAGQAGEESTRSWGALMFVHLKMSDRNIS